MVLILKKFKYYIAGILVLLMLFPLYIGYHSVPAVSGFVISSKHVVVIDPGHGGEDGGAVSISGTFESELNLDIAKRLDSIMGLYGVPVVMTRDKAELEYPDDAKTVRARKNSDLQRRVDLINSQRNPVLISIHQNNYPGRQPFGAQTFYGINGDGKNLAAYMQSLLVRELNPQNKRGPEEISDNIFIMKNVNCTSVLVECGFLSNPTEDALLKTDAYKLKISWIVASSYLGFYGGAVTNES